MLRLNEVELSYVLENTAGLWSKLENKSIFLTGGTGFFGKWLSESFIFINKALNLNAQLSILTRDPDAFLKSYPFYAEENSIRFIKGNILNFQFPVREFQFIIHAATDADAALNAENPLLMMDTVTAGTRRVLDFALQNPVESFLFTSSGAVYGRQPAEVTHIKETDSFAVDINNPASAYAEGKRMAELYCSTYYSRFHLPVKIARCFAFVGPYLPLNKHFAIGNFISNVLCNENIVIKSDGSPYRSYLYAADLTIWLWTILLNGKNNTPYNVGSNEDYDLKAIGALFKNINRQIEVEVLGTPDINKPLERYVPDITFISQQLGVKVQIDLLEAIKKTLDFYRD